jgi:hypothetical protein
VKADGWSTAPTERIPLAARRHLRTSRQKRGKVAPPPTLGKLHQQRQRNNLARPSQDTRHIPPTKTHAASCNPQPPPTPKPAYRPRP